MPISALPPAPQPTDTQAQFNTKAFNLVAALSTFVTQTNAVETAVDADAATAAAAASTATSAAATAAAAGTGITGTSTTSLAIGTGSKNLTIETGRDFVAGMPVRIGQAGANANVNHMDGDVTSYDAGTGALVVNVTAIGGTGTFAGWSVRARQTASATLQEFTSSGTWTKPAGATFVMAELWGAGGGGGSGRSGSSTTRGGGGGGGGAYGFRLFRAADLSASVAVTIGAGGAGGTSVAAGGGNGVAGSTGGASSFGSLLTIYGGSNGDAGQTGSANGGNGGGVLSAGGVPLVTYIGVGQDGHFGRGATAGGAVPGVPSGFGGGGGGGAGQPGGSSYQGGPGGGGGGGFSTDVEGGGVGGTIAGSNGGTANSKTYPGAAGDAGSGRQGGGGGASGYVAAALCYNVVYGNSTFAAVASQSGLILTSSNATGSWTFAQTPDSLPIRFITHDGTQFVLLNKNGTRCWTTTNFSTFTERAAPSASALSFSAEYPGIKYVNGNYFITHAQGLLRSTDLVTWASLSTGMTGAHYDICWSGTNYVLTGNNSPYVRYSSDLSSWSTPTGIGGSAAYFCTSNGSGTVVITQNAGNQAYRSTDHGVTFATVGTFLPNANAGLTYVNSTYFYAGGNELWTSTDGFTWTQRISAGTYNPYGNVAFDGTTLAVVNILSSTNIVITAVPASLGSWTARSLTARDVAAGAGGAGGTFGGGGGGGGASSASFASGAGGTGGAGYARIYTW